jgi:hypothetical protein
MAMTRATTSNTEHLDLIIDNGDFQTLHQTSERLGFLNEESMLRFMLAVLSRSATRSIIVTDQNGVKIPLTPNNTLLRSEEAAGE